MATWAFECRACGDDETVWYVAREAIVEMPHDVRVLRVRVGDQWLCATVDRSRPVSVEGMLLRDAVAADPADCPECLERLAPRTPEPSADLTEVHTPSAQIHAAAISLQGARFVVVLVSRELATNPGEADMLIADLRPRFGGVPIVLMGQDEAGTPTYYGDHELVDLLADVPVDRMPWKEYSV